MYLNLLKSGKYLEKLVSMTKNIRYPETWDKSMTASIGKKVRELRQNLGITVEQLSERTKKLGYEVPRNSITNLELGRKHTATVQDLLVLADSLKTDLPTLMGLSAEFEAKRFYDQIEAELHESASAVSRALHNFLDAQAGFLTSFRYGMSDEVIQEVDKYRALNLEVYKQYELWEILKDVSYWHLRNGLSHLEESKDERDKEEFQKLMSSYDPVKDAEEEFGVTGTGKQPQFIESRLRELETLRAALEAKEEPRPSEEIGGEA